LNAGECDDGDQHHDSRSGTPVGRAALGATDFAALESAGRSLGRDDAIADVRDLAAANEPAAR